MQQFLTLLSVSPPLNDVLEVLIGSLSTIFEAVFEEWQCDF